MDRDVMQIRVLSDSTGRRSVTMVVEQSFGIFLPKCDHWIDLRYGDIIKLVIFQDRETPSIGAYLNGSFLHPREREALLTHISQSREILVQLEEIENQSGIIIPMISLLTYQGTAWTMQID
jgi:hypothetical protein